MIRLEGSPSSQLLSPVIVGYSRIAGADEDCTLARLRALRRDRLDLAVTDLDQTQLKYIAEPIRDYALQVGVATHAKPAPRRSSPEKSDPPRRSWCCPLPTSAAILSRTISPATSPPGGRLALWDEQERSGLDAPNRPEVAVPLSRLRRDHGLHFRVREHSRFVDDGEIDHRPSKELGG